MDNVTFHLPLGRQAERTNEVKTIDVKIIKDITYRFDEYFKWREPVCLGGWLPSIRWNCRKHYVDWLFFCYRAPRASFPLVCIVFNIQLMRVSMTISQSLLQTDHHHHLLRGLRAPALIRFPSNSFQWKWHRQNQNTAFYKNLVSSNIKSISEYFSGANETGLVCRVWL